ncbi:hypothetical protein [Arthrobacter sp. KK5.5]|uniref:hypothetical protein n=1 Tax=Arthrobacter sp. KK5.5 TaxID=3373084 RepID=UPI003EE5D4A3
MNNSTTPAAAPAAPAVPQLVIPNFQPSAPTAMPWVATDYTYTLGATSHGATKLAESAVAPLVAAARGYRTATPSTAADAAKTVLGIEDMRTGAGKKLKEAAATGDALIMPWYSCTQVFEAATNGRPPERTTYQIRPANPEPDTKNKLRKYLNEARVETVIGSHPATPACYLDAQLIVVAEGLLKAEAALTAYLIANGATRAELANEHGGNMYAAQAALTAAMERIPAEDRVLVVEIIGCQNWRGKKDWATLALKNRAVWIAMDADVQNNPYVWDAAYDILSHVSNKGAEPSVLLLPGAEGKTGVDDFIAAGGRWSDLENLAVATLPERPGIKGRPARIASGVSDIVGGVTYGVEKGEDENGQPVATLVPWAEAAVQVTALKVVTSPYPSTMPSQRMSGTVTWLSEDAQGHETTNVAYFVDRPYALLTSGLANVPETLSVLTDGEASAVVHEAYFAGKTLTAWRKTSVHAERETTVQTTGMYEHNGRLVFLTTNGAITAGGFDPSLRGIAEGHPDTTTPFVDGDQEPKRVTEAFEGYSQVRGIFSPDFQFVWATTLSAIAATALGLQPQGGFLIFGKRGSGKTQAARCLSMPYGVSWGRRSPVKLNGTIAALTRQLLNGNNLMLGFDDARDNDDDKLNRELRTFIMNAIRIGYESDAVPTTSVRDASGNWITKPMLPFSVRFPLITGEDLPDLGLTPSTVQRFLSATPTEHNQLLAGRGEVKAMIDELERARAAEDLLGALLVAWLRKAVGTENPREVILAELNETVAKENTVMGAHAEKPGERDLELLAPLMAGLGAVYDMVADAYRAQGRDEEAADMAELLKEDREELVQAWRRHRNNYGDKAEATHGKYLATLNDLLATNRVCWGPPTKPEVGFAPLCIGRVMDNGNLRLVKSAAVEALQGTRNFEKLTLEKLELAMKEVSKQQKFRPFKGAGTVAGWEITPEEWIKATVGIMTDTELDRLDDEECSVAGSAAANMSAVSYALVPSRQLPAGVSRLNNDGSDHSRAKARLAARAA